MNVLTFLNVMKDIKRVTETYSLQMQRITDCGFPNPNWYISTQPLQLRQRENSRSGSGKIIRARGSDAWYKTVSSICNREMVHTKFQNCGCLNKGGIMMILVNMPTRVGEISQGPTLMKSCRQLMATKRESVFSRDKFPNMLSKPKWPSPHGHMNNPRRTQQIVCAFIGNNNN